MAEVAEVDLCHKPAAALAEEADPGDLPAAVGVAAVVEGISFYLQLQVWVVPVAWVQPG